MFQWEKSLKNLDVPADQLLQLFRSMRDVQLALPGTPAQEASAYLCQYQAGANVGTLVALHLQKSAQLAIYVDTPCEVPAEHAERSLDQALMFVESIGFLMNDLDIQILSATDRALLWESLPLRKGCLPAGKVSVVKPAQPMSPAKAAAPMPKGDPFRMANPSVAAAAEVTDTPPPAEAVDDLLAAVEALRAGRPGMRPRKKVPGPEELRRRRQELTANIGRILASL